MPTDNSLPNLLRNLVGPRLMPRIWGDALQSAQDDPAKLSHTLLTARGQASNAAIADRVLGLIEALDEDGFGRYFAALRDEFEVDLDAVLDAATRAQTEGATALKELRHAAEAPRQELFRRLNAAPDGTGRLVRIRAKLLRAVVRDNSLSPVDDDLKHLLRSWFNRGFLVPRRIDWNSPAALLEKIIAYEAVHSIDDWDALRQRLVPPDRLCYAFFHPAMPDEPLIFVEVALTNGIAASIQHILASPRAAIPADAADTAVFYSISNCQTGLAGISFGAFLIKQVARELNAMLPNLRTFSTLSPVPGLADWITQGRNRPETPEELLGLAADYLVTAKDRNGGPLDPVAKFHLGNGAQLHRINLDADLSEKGMDQSFGVMVNYLYELDRVEVRHEAFAASGEVAIARPVRAALTKPRARRPVAS